jgi:4-aminobutyrate aminotransferase-like enzyme
MLALDLGTAPGLSLRLKQRLLERGYIVSLGGGGRESVVLTPPLDIAEGLLQEFVRALESALGELSG